MWRHLSSLRAKNFVYFGRFSNSCTLRHKSIPLVMRYASTRSSHSKEKKAIIREVSVYFNHHNQICFETESTSYLDEILLKKGEKLPDTPAQKFKRGATNVFFISICVASAGTIVMLAYFLLEQFWAGDSPQRIYSKSLKLIRNNPQCIDIFGSKIAGYGEDTGRGRRRHITSSRYIKDGQKRVRVMFHLKASLLNLNVIFKQLTKIKFYIILLHLKINTTLIDNY